VFIMDYLNNRKTYYGICRHTQIYTELVHGSIYKTQFTTKGLNKNGSLLIKKAVRLCNNDGF
ncbi:MAG: hypothetical protein ACXVBK_16740, partial [Flavisolibacter sp.]